MVIEDFRSSGPGIDPGVETGKQIKIGSDGNGTHLARPFDRMASFVVDSFLILIPVGLLLISPLKRKFTEALIVQDEFSSALAMSSISIIFLVFSLGYFIFMTHVFGASFGQRLFGLRVQNIWTGEKIDLWQSAMRTFVLFAESLLLFLPALSVFSDSKRRAIHDRVSDSLVVSDPSRGSSEPSLSEVSFVKSLFASILVFVLLMIGFEATRWLQIFSDKDLLVIRLEQEGLLCADVGKTVREWEEKEGIRPPRLSSAMALFASGNLEKDCLKKEVDFALNQGEDESPLLYLALAFVHSDRPAVSNTYLDKTCEVAEESESCLMSRIVTEWSEENWEAVEELFANSPTPQEQHLMVWAIRYFMRHAEYTVVMDLINRLSPSSTLGSFLGIQRVKALWSIGRFREAQAATAVALDHMSLIDRLDLAGWVCLEELDQDCSGKKVSSCQMIHKTIESAEDYLLDPRMALTHTRFEECSETEPDYKRLAEESRIEEAKKFNEAMALINSSELEEGRKVLEDLVQDLSNSKDFRFEAERRLVETESDPSRLKEKYERWASEPQSLEWTKMGRTLTQAYINRGSYQLALEVGEVLLSVSPNDPTLRKNLVLSSYHTGRRRKAWEHLSRYGELKNPSTRELQRIPAAVSDFDVITNVLLKEFGKK